MGFQESYCSLRLVPDRLGLVRRNGPLLLTPREFVLILPVPRAIRINHHVQNQIPCVEAEGRAT